jgi:hypothetical protein
MDRACKTKTPIFIRELKLKKTKVLGFWKATLPNTRDAATTRAVASPEPRLPKRKPNIKIALRKNTNIISIYATEYSITDW